MKRHIFHHVTAKELALAVLIVALAEMTAGCASGARGGGTAALSTSSAVQGRDWGRGGATSGGISSVDPSGNAADWSVYDAREAQQ